MARRAQIIVQFWDVWFLELELVLAVGLTISFAGWLWWYDNAPIVVEGFLGDDRAILYRTLATVSGTMVGFSMTVAALVLTRIATERFQLLRSGRAGKNYEALWKTYTQAVKFLALLTVFSIAALILDTKDSPSHWVLIPTILLGLLSILRVGRAIWILEKLLKVPT